jgi:Family of unknown function (DUF6314)
MEPAVELWECLRRVRSLQFEARSSSPGGWNGAGIGYVAVESPADAVLTFTESGSWIPQGGRTLRFTNVFRWSMLGPAAIRLEHLRFGPAQPVLLFDMTPIGPGEWTSASPHLCREDCYSAKLRMDQDGFLLYWTIAGPRKRESIEYVYRW